MAIITTAITTLTDLNDAIISGTQPINPTAGTLWIDSSKSPAVLKIYKNGAWMAQDLDLNSLDPDMAESIRNVVATIGNMSNDNLLDYKERQIIKDDLTEILGKVLLDTETILPTVAQLDSLAKGSFYSTRRNALSAGIEITNTTYVNVATQYQNLKTYLESLAPIKPWNVAVADKDKNVTVIKNTFRDKWLQYYLATEQLSLTTTEKIKEAQENLDGKIDEVSLRDKTEILSGNPVFTDKSDDAVVHVGVDGKSVGGGSGKNLLYEHSPTEKTGSFTMNSYEFRVNDYYLPTISKGGKYTASIKVSDMVGFPNGLAIMLSVRNSNGSAYSQMEGSSKVNSGYTGVVKSSFDVPAFPDDKFVTIHLRDSTNAGGSVKFKEAQLELGTTSTTYEPPAPSPDYPVAINSLDKSFDIVSSVGKQKNYFSLAKLKTQPLTVPWSNYPTLETKALEYTFEPNSPVTITTNTPSGTTIYFNSSSVSVKQNTPLTLRTDNNGKITVFIVKGRANYDEILNGTYWIQVENSDSATAYEPSPEDISYNVNTNNTYKTNISLSEPLRSVGDVKDRLFLDTDGLWKVERNVGEKVFNGTESWSYEPSSKGYWTPILGKQSNSNEATIHVSSHFKLNNASLLPLGTTRNGSGTNTLFNWDDGVSGVAVFKNWLVAQNTAGTPVIVQYRLATPTIETLSAEQQTKLNNIPSYKNSTYVYILFPDGQGGYY